METSDEESQSLLKSDKISNSADEIQQVVLKWENLSFKIKSNDTCTEILKNLSGFSNPSEIFAVMGASGSGKTTLLSLLSNQLIMESKFDVTGEIWLNSEKQKNIKTSTIVRYISQESILFEFLTPYEFLKFTLGLKVNRSAKSIKARVDTILEQFKLTSVKNSIIGGLVVKGLSGGEKKRLAIAAEILVNPSIIILDEPTSGLDSYMAKCVLNLLKDLTKTGVNVVMTIHQPSYEIFQMIDRLALMQEGQFVYQGNCKESVNYFKLLGYEVPLHVNPPEFYMKILKVEDRNNKSPEETNTTKLFLLKYQENIIHLYDEINKNCLESPIIEFEYDLALKKNSKILFNREVLNFKRNPLIITFKLGQIIIFVIVLNSIYNNLGYGNQGVEERKGAIVSILFIFTFISCYTVSINVACERKIIMKELKEELYNLNIYYLAKLLLELPIVLINSAVLVFATYFVLDLNQESSDRVFILLFITIITYFQGLTLGLLAGSLSVIPMIANAVGATISTCMMIFAGFYNDPECSPSITSWLRYTTPYYFLRNAALKNEFDDLNLDDEVVFEPDDRYNYKGEVYENIFYTFIHLIIFYLLALASYLYQVRRSKINLN